MPPCFRAPAPLSPLLPLNCGLVVHYLVPFLIGHGLNIYAVLLHEHEGGRRVAALVIVVMVLGLVSCRGIGLLVGWVVPDDGLGTIVGRGTGGGEGAC